MKRKMADVNEQNGKLMMECEDAVEISTNGQATMQTKCEETVQISTADKNNEEGELENGSLYDAASDMDSIKENVSQLDTIKGLLDEVEDQIEQVRSQAEQLLEEKEDIQTTLDMIANPEQMRGLSDVDKEEVMVCIERLNNRINAVNVTMSTVRSGAQLESLHSVNRAIDTLIVQIQTDTSQAKILCSQYLSATGLDMDHSADVKFEQHLLGCTAEDQKLVKKRLLGLLDHIKVIVGDSIKETA